jgi:hypothetical protein
MAFCNSCGATQEVGARFCAKCGAAAPAGAAIPVAGSSLPTAQPQNNNSVKIGLMVVAAIVILGVIGAGFATFIGLRIAHHAHIENKNGNVRVQTPFGTVQSTNDSDEASRNLGIDLYPGAQVLKGNTATIGGMHTVEAEFESEDSAEKVMAFYASKLPNANVTVADQNHYTLVSTDKKNLITINIVPEDGKTRISIANLSGKNVTSNNSPD